MFSHRIMYLKLRMEDILDKLGILDQCQIDYEKFEADHEKYFLLTKVDRLLNDEPVLDLNKKDIDSLKQLYKTVTRCLGQS